MQDTKIQEWKNKIRSVIGSASPNGDTSVQGLILGGIAAILEGEHPNPAQDVFDFHKKYGIEYIGAPRFLPEDINTFRDKRLEEELIEYMDAKTLEEKLDALVDLIYIALGNAHLHGFTVSIFNEAWRRVQIANMAKVRASEENPGKYGQLGCKHDIVKPPGWKAPDHSDLVKCENS
jgi:predicted HAD superfamily Cof-like phosphohydrolase